MESAQDRGLIVVGGGHAGSELALAARANGWRGPITLLGDERTLPYQRPPLSKAWLAGQADDAALALRPLETYQAADIALRQGVRVVSIDRAARTVATESGERLPYAKLALCTGGRPRPLACPGVDAGSPPANLFYLRTKADAEAIRQALQQRPGARVAILGAGYVGLEVAASARKLGAGVTVIEAQPRVLARVAGEAVSRFYERVHREAGVAVLTGTMAVSLDVAGGRITALRCADGRVVAADLVVAGLGMLPNIDAARAAGLADADGVLVDSCSLTADPDIVAAGDCTVQHGAPDGRRIRLESVPNALEQARAAAASVCGLARPNLSVPWFWSDQYDLKLQTAGLSHGHDACVVRGDPARPGFCAFYLREGRLLAVDAVNRPAEFMLTRRALAQRPMVDADALEDESVPLKDVLAGLHAAAVTGKP